MERFVIGIDIGTGSIKAVAVYQNGHTQSVQQTYATSYTEAGFSEQDPEEIWLAFIECLNKLIRETTNHPAALCFSSAMHSLMLVNGNNQAITPLIIWSDTRSATIAETLKNTKEGALFYANTGTPIHSMSPLCKIKWLAVHQPSVFKTAHKFISIKEYIWYKLFGVYEVDYSIASATGLFNVHHLKWYDKALVWAGITPEQLSKPVPVNQVRHTLVPENAALLDLTQESQFFIGASDGCLANVGSQAIAEGTAAITIGSSGAVRRVSKTPVLHFPAMPFSYRLNSNDYVCGGPVNNGGIVIKWLLQTFLGIDAPAAADYNYVFEQIATVKTGCNGLVFLPYLTGERAPVWDAKAAGTYIGLTIQHTTAHLMRAAVEGLCFAVHEALQLIEAPPTTIQKLHVSGGFTHSPIWMQMLADVTGKTLHLYQTEDASALGAAYLCFQELRMPYQTPQQAAQFTPNHAVHLIYRQVFSIYQTLYPTLKNTLHTLYQLNK